MGTTTSQWNFDIPQNLLDAADRLDGEPTLQFEVDDDEDDCRGIAVSEEVDELIASAASVSNRGDGGEASSSKKNPFKGGSEPSES